MQSANTIPQAINIPVTFVVGNSQSTTITAIANGASYAQAFAPGTLMTVFGTQLSSITRSAGVLPLPLDISGVSATVNGVSAPLYYVSPGQINVQVPYETGTGLAILGVNNNGQVASFPFTVAPAAPGAIHRARWFAGPLVHRPAGPERSRLYYRRRRHYHLPDHRREPSQRHHYRPPAAYPPARHRNRGRPACHRDLRRNAHRPGRHLASQLHRPCRHPAGVAAGDRHRRRSPHPDGPPHRHSIEMVGRTPWSARVPRDPLFANQLRASTSTAWRPA